jgi:hypothetical protein
MLGFSRLQRRRLRRHREPAPKMHGRPSSPSCAGEYDQLPPVADAEIRYEPEEAEIKNRRKMMYQKGRRKKFFASLLDNLSGAGDDPCTIFFRLSIAKKAAQLEAYIRQAKGLRYESIS